MNVGWKVEYVDKQGNKQALYTISLEGAWRLSDRLKKKKCTSIRISDAPQSVPKKERAR